MTWAVDVMNGWSHCSFVVLLVRVCVRPLQWFGNRVVLHGSVTLPCSIDWSPSDQLYSSVNGCRNRKKKHLSNISNRWQFTATNTNRNTLILARTGQKLLTLRKCASPEGFHKLIHLNKRTLKQTNTLFTLWTFLNHKHENTKMLQLTVKHVGGGSSFIRTTAAGGTGKTPPGTGCSPGAVVRKKAKTEKVSAEKPEDPSMEMLPQLRATYGRGGVVGRGSSG